MVQLVVFKPIETTHEGRKVMSSCNNALTSKHLANLGCVFPLTLCCAFFSHLVVFRITIWAANFSVTPVYWLFKREALHRILIIRNILASIQQPCNPCNYQPTGVLNTAHLRFSQRIQGTSLNPFWRRKFPKISAVFGWPSLAPVAFSRIESCDLISQKMNSSFMGTGKQITRQTTPLLHCIYNILHLQLPFHGGFQLGKWGYPKIDGFCEGKSD